MDSFNKRSAFELNDTAREFLSCRDLPHRNTATARKALLSVRSEHSQFVLLVREIHQYA
jgi:hypothetical protein